MKTQTDRAGSRQAEKITIGQVAEKLLLIARLLERAEVSHEARLQRLAEEYRNVNPGDDKHRAELQKDIADCGKAPLAIMEDSVRKMAAMMKVAAESQLLDAEAAKIAEAQLAEAPLPDTKAARIIAATHPSKGVSWFEYLADLQRHYCGIAAPTMGDMEVTASAIDAIARAMVKPKPAAGLDDPAIKPLTPREQYTVRALLSCGPLEAMTGDKIIDYVYKTFNHNMDSSTLTAVFKALADNGIVIEHRRGAGYFISDRRIRDILAKTYPPIQPAKTKV